LAQAVKAANQMGILGTDWGFLAVRAPGANSILGVVYAWNTAMPEPALLPWSPEAVLAASILDKTKPSQMRSAVFAPIPLESVGNRTLSGDANSWFGISERYHLSCLPTGAQRMFGVNYQIGSKCVVVNAQEPAKAIPVSAKAKSLIFLHALHVHAPTVEMKTYGQYHVTYANGEKVTVAIDSTNATHWLTEERRENGWCKFISSQWSYAYTWDAMLAWEGCTKSAQAVNLQAYEWVNPRPDDPITAVEVIARKNIPGLQIALVALTAVR
jgi:hypothetical protein